MYFKSFGHYQKVAQTFFHGDHNRIPLLVHSSRCKLYHSSEVYVRNVLFWWPVTWCQCHSLVICIIGEEQYCGQVIMWWQRRVFGVSRIKRPKPLQASVIALRLTFKAHWPCCCDCNKVYFSWRPRGKWLWKLQAVSPCQSLTALHITVWIYVDNLYAIAIVFIIETYAQEKHRWLSLWL